MNWQEIVSVESPCQREQEKQTSETKRSCMRRRRTERTEGLFVQQNLDLVLHHWDLSRISQSCAFCVQYNKITLDQRTLITSSEWTLWLDKEKDKPGLKSKSAFRDVNSSWFNGGFRYETNFINSSNLWCSVRLMYCFNWEWIDSRDALPLNWRAVMTKSSSSASSNKICWSRGDSVWKPVILRAQETALKRRRGQLSSGKSVRFGNWSDGVLERSSGVNHRPEWVLASLWRAKGAWTWGRKTSTWDLETMVVESAKLSSDEELFFLEFREEECVCLRPRDEGVKLLGLFALLLTRSFCTAVFYRKWSTGNYWLKTVKYRHQDLTFSFHVGLKTLLEPASLTLVSSCDVDHTLLVLFTSVHQVSTDTSLEESSSSVGKESDEK